MKATTKSDIGYMLFTKTINKFIPRLMVFKCINDLQNQWKKGRLVIWHVEKMSGKYNTSQYFIRIGRLVPNYSKCHSMQNAIV